MPVFIGCTIFITILYPVIINEPAMKNKFEKLIGWPVLLLVISMISGCIQIPTPTPPATNTFVAPPFNTSTPHPTRIPVEFFYVDPTQGSDGNPGTQVKPWRSIEKAVQTATAGDVIYLRAGEYISVFSGWSFANSGNASKPITISNQPGEQAIIRLSPGGQDYRAFRCWFAAPDPQSWQTAKADYIRIIGSDVPEVTLSNGVKSTKGIVIQGSPGEQATGIEAAGCDNWEVAGVDFVDVAYGIFTKKRNFRTAEDYSPDYWYVHDNRVFGYYRESGMQFNGNFNLVENNQIYKVSDSLDTPYGCQLINLNGNNNTIRGNTLSRWGSKANCGGILLEWDLADANLIENNIIGDVPWALSIAGGDNNIFRNNLLYVENKDWLLTFDYEQFSGWPCNEESNSTSDIPAENPRAADYKYYYPHDCHSTGNQVLNNILK